MEDVDVWSQLSEEGKAAVKEQLLEAVQHEPLDTICRNIADVISTVLACCVEQGEF